MQKILVNRYFQISFLMFWIQTNKLCAQQNILLNQSSYNLFILNPAALGLNNDFNANCHYKKNWMGISESPELTQVTLDGSLAKNKYGLGLNLINEKAGIFSKTYMTAAFRYKVKLNKKHNLLFGLSAGFQKQQSDFSKIKADSPEEFSLWPQQQSVTIPDASFGLVYSHKNAFIAMSASQILQQDYTYKEPTFNKTISYKTIPQYVISIQNTFILKPEIWKYTPHITLRTPQGLPFQFDFVNTFIYKNKLLLGIGYRTSYALYSNIGLYITDKLRVIYSYEYSLGIQSISKGGHEIGISFGLKNLTHKTSNSPENTEQRKLDEIFEKIDQQDQRMETLSKKVDSLDKNLSLLKSEIEQLKNQQLNPNEVKNAVEDYLSKENKMGKSQEPEKTNKNNTSDNNIDTHGKYKVISPKTESDFEKKENNPPSNYKIVLGVYQLANYAKEYQKFLKREIKLETTLIQLPDHPKKYIYVCALIEFSDLNEALKCLQMMRKNIQTQAIEVTKGEAWILQTLIN